jgi:hypothetical protein
MSWQNLMEVPIPTLLETYKLMDWEAKEMKRMKKRMKRG